jgi:hypothetical protein
VFLFTTSGEEYEINKEYPYHANWEGKKKPLSSITVRRREEAEGSIWSDRFLKSAIVQGSIVTGLAIIFVLTSFNSYHYRLKAQLNGYS